jgi:hypothetical protein
MSCSRTQFYYNAVLCHLTGTYSKKCIVRHFEVAQTSQNVLLQITPAAASWGYTVYESNADMCSPLTETSLFPLHTGHLTFKVISCDQTL